MLASSLLAASRRLAGSNRAGPLLGEVMDFVSLHQVRFASRKTFCLQYRYGLQPLYTDHMYNEAVEQGRLEELAFEKIRFPSLWETNSPLKDDLLEKYVRYMMLDGRRYLNYELMHKTFYEIKTTQFRRKRKLESKRQQQQQQNQESGKEPSGSAAQDDDEHAIELDPMKLFHAAVENCKPMVVTRKIKRGGATYQVPYPVVASQSEWMSMRWLNTMVKDRPKPRKKHYHEELAQEIIDAAQGRGKVVKRKDDIHKLALANKAYAHYRWG